ncbi:flagellar motor switch protein FliM [Jatrophihabitans sp. GAS493]|uniref:flagellar motor switch protein FliM n=1 Tax=Jatrophihabitans sp. GAS493 TaxID=1907575 RepID=UPI001560CFF7|nr:FliM/FliN family flagellar motor switch protein [Jatrophihabitans sp. GAS493]
MTAINIAAKRALASPPRDAPVAYDFRRPTKLSREHVRALQMCCELFGKRLTTLLTGSLRQVCHIDLVSIEQQSYEEYVTTLESPTILAPFSIDPLQGTAILQFALSTAMTSIDHLLGGPGGEQPGRTLTDTETGLLNDLMEQMLSVLRYGFESMAPMKTKLAPIEYNPQFVQAAAATDAVVVASFDLTVGASSCLLTLCLPLSPVVAQLQAERAQRSHRDQEDPNRDASARKVRDGLGGVEIDVVVQFDAIALDTSRLLTLAEGDVIKLTHRVNAPLTVEAGGTTFAHAIAGKSGERLAALIIEPLQTQPATQERL